MSYVPGTIPTMSHVLSSFSPVRYVLLSSPVVGESSRAPQLERSRALTQAGSATPKLLAPEGPGRRPGPRIRHSGFVPVQSCPPAAGLPRHPCRARHSLHSSPVHPFVCIGEVLWLTFDSLSEYSSPCTPKLSSYCPGTEWVIHKCGQS